MMNDSSNFIKTIMKNELETGIVDHILTRFPPEPNAYLHIGHARAIIMNLNWPNVLVVQLIFDLTIQILQRKIQNMLMQLKRILNGLVIPLKQSIMDLVILMQHMKKPFF